MKFRYKLPLMLFLNVILLILYYGYLTKEQEINLKVTTLPFITILQRHQQDEIEQDIEESEEEYYTYFNEFPQEKADIGLINDVNNILQAIGDDDVDSDYLINAVKDINPIELQMIPMEIRKQTQLNILKDQNYCSLNNLYILHSDLPINIITDYPSESLISQILDQAGKDVLPNIQIDTDKLYHMPYQATVYFMANLNFHKYFAIGTEAICNFQIYNHIPGMEILFKKSSMVQFLQNIDISQPFTYVMRNKTQCQQFFEDKMQNEYLIKKNGKTKPLQTLDLVRRKYQDSNRCGKIMDDIIIQQKVNKEKRFFSILLINMVTPIQYQIFHGYYYKVNKGNFTEHSKYNETINQLVEQQVSQILHNINLLEDNRFFQILRLEFIETQNEIFLMSINNNIEKDQKIEQFLTSVIVSSLKLLNFQSKQRLELYKVEHHQH